MQCKSAFEDRKRPGWVATRLYQTAFVSGCYVAGFVSGCMVITMKDK